MIEGFCGSRFDNGHCITDTQGTPVRANNRQKVCTDVAAVDSCRAGHIASQYRHCTLASLFLKLARCRCDRLQSLLPAAVSCIPGLLSSLRQTCLDYFKAIIDESSLQDVVDKDAKRATLKGADFLMC